jgi:glutaredoxin-like YruB-family protein
LAEAFLREVFGMAKEVKIYSTPTCPYCKMAKEYLKKNNIAFENIDVSTDQNAAKEMVDKSGQMGVPVLDIDGEIIVGFDKPKISAKLGLK